VPELPSWGRWWLYLWVWGGLILILWWLLLSCGVEVRLVASPSRFNFVADSLMMMMMMMLYSTSFFLNFFFFFSQIIGIFEVIGSLSYLCDTFKVYTLGREKGCSQK